MTRRTYSNCVFPRMPAAMKYFLVEINRVHVHLLLQVSRSYTVLLWPALIETLHPHLLRLEGRLVCLQQDIVCRLYIKYSEVVVV